MARLYGQYYVLNSFKRIVKNLEKQQHHINNTPEDYLYLHQKRKLGLVKRIKKQINKFGLTNEDLELNTNNCYTVT